MRVSLLNPCYWPEVRRGSERLVHDLAVDLGRTDSVRILTSHGGRWRRTHEDGVEVLRTPRLPDRPLRDRMVQPHLTHLPFAWWALTRGDDDIAHAFHPTDAIAATRWARAVGRPAVLTWAGVANRESLAGRWHSLRVVHEATRRSDAVITLSRAARDALWRWTRTESRVISPGVDLTAFRPGAERSATREILCPSALDDWRKRGDLLLTAFAALRRRRPDVGLVLQRPADEGLRRTFAAVPGVRLESFDATSQLVAAYRRAWLTVLPAIGEAFGLVVAESLACGTPAVVSAIGGSAEVVGDDPTVGRVFSGDSPHDLARAMDDGLEAATVPGSAEACRARAKLFAQDRCTASHRALYGELTGA